MPTINWNQGTINFSDEGRGTAVLLLHGFCESMMVWDDWKEDLLEENYRVIALDLPGFGGSDAKATSIAQMGQAVMAVCEHLGLKKGICVGHSMGGYVALEVAAAQPAWLIGLGLFHSHPFADDEDQAKARQKSIDFIERNGHVHYVKQLIPRLFAQRTGTSASFRRDMLILRASRSGSAAIVTAIKAMARRMDHSKTLKRFGRPVLFINGARDPIYTTRQRQDQLALAAVSDVHILERTGHMGMIEEKQTTQRAVRQFVRFCEEW
ncbi:hypothetical protein CEQ90_02780 [Lewinellaceae bacterium SD302]|nr:hypothetical protein CEQ90_02780 [Lewinellaceae bacterium SD302]